MEKVVVHADITGDQLFEINYSLEEVYGALEEVYEAVYGLNGPLEPRQGEVPDLMISFRNALDVIEKITHDVHDFHLFYED